MKKRRLNSVVQDYWQTTLYAFLFVGALVLLYGLRFGIAPAIASGELQVAASGTETILRNPLYLHHQIIQKLLLLVGVDSLYAVRAVPIINTVLSIGGLFFVLRCWFAQRIVVLGTALYALSGWVLHVARIGTVDSNYLLITLPLLGLAYLNANKYSLRGTLLVLLSSVVLLYIPGMIWFMVPVFLWRRKLLLQTVKNLKIGGRAAIALCLILGLLPLVVSVVLNAKILLNIAGLPQSVAQLTNVPAQILDGIRSVFVSQPIPTPVLTIADLSFLPIAILLLIVLGTTYFYHDRGLVRTKVIFGCTILGILLHGLSAGMVSMTITLPFLFILAAAGIAHLLQSWGSVFPKNPIAKRAAITCMVLVIGFICATELHSYFIAWPHSDTYQTVFSQNNL